MPARFSCLRPVPALLLLMLLPGGLGAGQADQAGQAAPVAARAAESAESGVRGVNPADNLTKFEVQPRLGVIDDAAGISTTTLTLKYDRAIQGRFGVNIELPLARFEGAGLSANGIGDVNLRGRYQTSLGPTIVIVGAEAVLPAASDDLLGAGKWQLNPTVAMVYPLGKTTFLAGVVKSVNSVAGEDDRPDLRQVQLRTLLGYSSPKGWWVLADPQYFIDRREGDRAEFVFEAEYGRMIAQTTGIWLRAGGRLGGSWDRSDWTVGGGIRFISF